MVASGLDPSSLYKIQEIKALTKERNSSEALALLQKAALQVQPLLRRRQWRVPLMSEFVPRSPNLLGLNIGGGGGSTMEIKIRLRPPGSKSEFFPYEHVLGTLLHELTHNIHGPHNASFYKLLDEITKECEDLMAKGISGSGQGFEAPSKGRLGGRGPVPIHNPDPRKLHDTMLKAAEERARKQAVMSAGPQRLGGDTSLRSQLTPAQAAAQAAERRARDNVWCPNGELGTGVGYSEDEGGVIVLDDSQPSPSPSSDATTQPPHPAGSQPVPPSTSASESRAALERARLARLAGRSGPCTTDRADRSNAAQKISSAPFPAQPGAHGTAGGWGGSAVPAAKPEGSGRGVRSDGTAGPAGGARAAVADAAVLGSVRRQRRAAGGGESAGADIVDLTELEDGGEAPAEETREERHKRMRGSGTEGSEGPVWACGACTLLNPTRQSTCAACGQWRYSRGLPAASRPTLGGIR